MNGIGKLVKKDSTVLGEFFADRLVNKMQSSVLEKIDRELADFIAY